MIQKLLIIIAVVMMSSTCAQKCKKINSCKCEMEDKSGVINLRSLAHPGNLPKWTLSGGDGWMYKYNPCIGYALGTYPDLAVGQAATAGTVYDLGVQSSATFNATDDGKITIKYIAKDKLRSTTVILKCDRNGKYDRLDFMGEVRMTEYEMVLTSPCACPGYCDDLGIYDDIARNISESWDDRYHDKRPSYKPDEQAKTEKSLLVWPEMASSALVLVLHDIALVIIVITCFLIVRHYMFGRRRNGDSKRKNIVRLRHCDGNNGDNDYVDDRQLQIADGVKAMSYKVTSEVVSHTCCNNPSHQQFLTRPH